MDPYGRFGWNSRFGSTVSVVGATIGLVATVSTGSPVWIAMALLWIVLVVIMVRIWMRGPRVAAGLGIQVGVAEAGPWQGRDIAATHDGTTWTLDVAADPTDPEHPAASVHSFDNDEFPSIETRWAIRWDAS